MAGCSTAQWVARDAKALQPAGLPHPGLQYNTTTSGNEGQQRYGGAARCNRPADPGCKHADAGARGVTNPCCLVSSLPLPRPHQPLAPAAGTSCPATAVPARDRPPAQTAPPPPAAAPPAPPARAPCCGWCHPAPAPAAAAAPGWPRPRAAGWQRGTRTRPSWPSGGRPLAAQAPHPPPVAPRRLRLVAVVRPLLLLLHGWRARAPC